MIGLSLVLSCTKEGLNPVNKIEDLYTVPADATELPTLTSSNSTWSLDRRYFDLTFGDALTTRLVGYDALLASGQYILGGDEIGKAILANTKVKGQAAKEGFVTVNSREGKYAITAQIDGEVLAWTGTLPFVADPDPLALSEVLQAQSNAGSGVKSVTMQLATPGIHQEFDMQTYQTVWVGEGKYLAIDLYSEDGYLHDGNYKACAEGGIINPGEFGIGYDTTIQYGEQFYVFKDWGTCLWTVANGVATAEKITAGLVTVTSREEKVNDKDVTIWTIFWGENYPKEVIFEGAIPALTKPKKPVGPVTPTHKYTIGEPQPCSTQSGEAVSGVKKYPFTITDDKNQEVAYLEFVLTDGATDIEPGDYVSTEYAHEAGQLANGYYLDYTEYGFGIIAGGSYYINEAGEKTYIAPGVTVSVSKIGTGAFQFTSTGFSYPAAGPNYVPDAGGDYDGPIYDMTDTVAADCTDANNTPYTDVESHTFVLKNGEEFVAQIKLIRSVGATDFAGEYGVVEYAHEDFKAGNGFDLSAMFGMEAGSWVIGTYYMNNGAIVIVEPGESITVSSLGNNTWKFEGSTGYTFAGKLQ